MAAELKAGKWGHKYGPLPLWAWGGLGLGGALAISSWRKNKAAAKATPTVDQASTQSTAQTPPYVVINDLYTGTTTTPTPVVAPPVSGSGNPKPKPKPKPKPVPVPEPIDLPSPEPVETPPEPTPQPVPAPLPPPFVVPQPPPVVYPPPDYADAPPGFAPLPGINGITWPPPNTPAPVVRNVSPVAYRALPGDSFSKIAAKYGVFGGNGLSLYNYNINSAGRSSADIATLKQRGPNLIYSGETVYIPR